MTTKRTRRARGTALPEEIIEVLGYGGGLHSYNDDWIVQQWQIYGDQLTVWWQRQFGEEPLINEWAEREGWATRRIPEVVVKLKKDQLS
jgi:hypothetical protein